MKFSTAVGLAATPLAVARNVRNVFNGPNEAEPELVERAYMQDSGSDMGSKDGIAKIWDNAGKGAPNKSYNKQVTVTQTVTAGSMASAPMATHTVLVGGTAGLVYTPPQLSANVGDMVVFEFLKQNHTLTQSSFLKPCVKMAGGLDTGFVPNMNNDMKSPPRMAIQVKVSTPLWFYCAQKTHCGKGMVFAINPTPEKTFAKFQQMAIQQNGTAGGGMMAPAGAPAGYNQPAAYNSPAAASPAAAAPPAPAAPPAANAAMPAQAVATGMGSVGADGSCMCVASCQSGSFPSPAQGMGAMGGMAGSLDMSAMGSMDKAPGAAASAMGSSAMSSDAPMAGSDSAPMDAKINVAAAQNNAAAAPAGGDSSSSADQSDVSDTNPLGGAQG